MPDHGIGIWLGAGGEEFLDRRTQVGARRGDAQRTENRPMMIKQTDPVRDAVGTHNAHPPSGSTPELRSRFVEKDRQSLCWDGLPPLGEETAQLQRNCDPLDEDECGK